MDRARTRLWTAPVMVATLVALAMVTPVSAGAPQRDLAAEELGLSLLNCTRTGGWVRADGTCKGGGTGMYSAMLPELVRHDGISRKVAFRWASQLVQADVCDHVIPGKPILDARFSSAGFRYSYVGENVGCSWGGASPEEMVLRAHRSMQAEKGTGGWHWRNMKNRGFKGVGIGVATLGSMTTIVYDFYGR